MMSMNALNKPKKVSLVSGENVKKIIQKKIERSLTSSKIKYVWHLVKSNEVKAISQVQKSVKKDKSTLIVGIGGGRSVDIAKMIGFKLKIPLQPFQVLNQFVLQ